METTKKKFNYNILSVIFIYALTLLFLFSSFTIEVKESRTFPQVLCILSLVLATFFLFLILKGKEKYNGEDIDMAGTGNAMKMGLLILLYIIAIYLGGYYIATLVYMPAAMLTLGRRKWLGIVLVTVAYVLITYLFFGLLLSMQMPEALLFK